MAHCPKCGADKSNFAQNTDGSFYCTICAHNCKNEPLECKNCDAVYPDASYITDQCCAESEMRIYQTAAKPAITQRKKTPIEQVHEERKKYHKVRIIGN